MVGSSTARSLGRPGAPPPSLQIVNWPLRDDGIRGWLMVVLLVGVAAVAGEVAHSVPMGSVAFVALATAAWRLWIPVRFEFNTKGITETVFGPGAASPGPTSPDMKSTATEFCCSPTASPACWPRSAVSSSAGVTSATSCRRLWIISFNPTTMSRFVHQRHKPPDSLDIPRELLVVCAPLRSNVNFSRIVRAASCCGVRRIVACGRPRLDPEIARIEEPDLSLETHRTLPPVLAKLRHDGYQLVGLEQATNSESLFTFAFTRRTALVIGNERLGLTRRVVESAGPRGGNPRLWAPLQPQRGHRRGHGGLRVLPPVSPRLTGFVLTRAKRPVQSLSSQDAVIWLLVSSAAVEPRLTPGGRDG